MLTQERLKELLHYDFETGWFTNLISRSSRAQAGQRAGTHHPQGYRQIQIGGTFYKEHQLAWLYVYGYIPEEIDHKDGDRSFSAIDNLREATRSQNNANADRQTGIGGLRGVTWFARDQKWKAQIKINGQSQHLGYFDTVEQAHAAYLNAADLHHGEFAFHNREQSIEQGI